MKKTIFLFVLIGLMASNAFAGKKKTSPQEKRAKLIIAYVAQEMEFNDIERKVLFDALVTKITSNRALSKDLSKEAKKAAYKKIRMTLIADLATQFDKSEIKQISDLMKAYNAEEKKKKAE